MFFVGTTAARRAMRRHQGLDTGPRPRLPLWRLLLGELRWALRQLRAEPWVAAALVLGVVAVLAAFGAAAPGPVLPLPGRIVVALVVGLVMARGTWMRIRRQRVSSRRPASAQPGLAATEVVGAVAAVVLLVWFLVWVVGLVR